ncbi:MAG: hypothetical protein KY455_08190 [Euryarchaeota archaeon]|nr:hypothetical protein [Euryarchaeota archaeon]
MPGERWEDKRARAVLFAGANKLARDGQDLDPEAVAETGLHVRDHLFVDKEVREENADVKANRIGYSHDCMQFATLEPQPAGLWLSLWVGPDKVAEAKETLGAVDDPNAFRRMFGWVRVPIAPRGVPGGLEAWVERAVRHAAEEKKRQAQTAR